MSDHYTNSFSGTAGSLARAETVNSQFDAVETGFTALEAEVDQAIRFTGGDFVGGSGGNPPTLATSAANRMGKVVYFNAATGDPEFQAVSSLAGVVIGTDSGDVAGVSELFLSSELTIASGAVTPVKGHHSIDTESDASTDDLDTLTGTALANGYILRLRNASSNRVATVKHGTGNIYLVGDKDFALTDENRLTLQRHNASWYEVGRSRNTPRVASVGAIAAHKNLVVTRVSSTTVDIDADAVELQNSAGESYVAESVNLTLAITASGALGLDTGSEGSDTWYYLHVIYNGTTVSGVLSESRTAPTLPSGYTFSGLVGAAYNNASSNLDQFYQINKQVSIAVVAVLSAGAETSVTAISLAAVVPSKVCAVLGSGQANPASGGTLGRAQLFSDAAGALGRLDIGARSSSANGEDAPFFLGLAADQNIYYSVDSGDTLDLNVSGYCW